MKKTLTINISGIILNIDEDAYDKLQNYLKAINMRFSATEEDREIISDIESRIAEVFQEILTDSKQVISIEDVEKVAETMGEPEDIADGTEAQEKEEEQNFY